MQPCVPWGTRDSCPNPTSRGRRCSPGVTRLERRMRGAVLLDKARFDAKIIQTVNTHYLFPLRRWLVLMACFFFQLHLAMAQGTGVWRELWSGLSTSDTSIGGLTNVANNPNWPNNPTAGYTKV